MIRQRPGILSVLGKGRGPREPGPSEIHSKDLADKADFCVTGDVIQIGSKGRQE